MFQNFSFWNINLLKMRFRRLKSRENARAWTRPFVLEQAHVYINILSHNFIFEK